MPADTLQPQTGTEMFLNLRHTVQSCIPKVRAGFVYPAPLS